MAADTEAAAKFQRAMAKKEINLQTLWHKSKLSYNTVAWAVRGIKCGEKAATVLGKLLDINVKPFGKTPAKKDGGPKGKGVKTARVKMPKKAAKKAKQATPKKAKASKEKTEKLAAGEPVGTPEPVAEPTTVEELVNGNPEQPAA